MRVVCNIVLAFLTSGPVDKHHASLVLFPVLFGCLASGTLLASLCRDSSAVVVLAFGISVVDGAFVVAFYWTSLVSILQLPFGKYGWTFLCPVLVCSLGALTDI